MDYSLYFESAPQGKDPENQFQYTGKGDIVAWAIHRLFTDMQENEAGKFIDLSDTKLEFINSFLDYHFLKYTGNPEQFFLCIKEIQLRVRSTKENSWIPGAKEYYARLYELYNPIIEAWIIQARKKPQHKKPIENLKGACKGLKEYESLRAWFIENKFCDPDTFDYDSKKYPLYVLASYLKDLNKKGYAKKLKQVEIKAIAKNSFNAEMEIDTIKSAKADTSDLHSF
jgi:hypothetical protein